ncbi:MAG: hypothetical protein Kow0069_12450 [Promethearchaeota archaeon]
MIVVVVEKFTKHAAALASFLAVDFTLAGHVIINRPLLEGPAALANTHEIFGLSVNSLVLIWAIAAFLTYRWFVTGRKNVATISWSVGFWLYGILFLAFVLQALGTPGVDMNVPTTFFLFRQTMILWVALLYFGLAKLLFTNRAWILVPTAVFVAAGYGIFTWGLILLGDIERTMYAFLFLELIPICVIDGYLFMLYGNRAGIRSTAYLGAGFFGIAATYAAWAPWHLTFFYLVWFFLFQLSLVPLLIGFLLLSKDLAIRELEKALEVARVAAGDA